MLIFMLFFLETAFSEIDIEYIVSFIVGLAVTMGATQFIKTRIGVGSLGATILAAVLSFVIGLITVFVQMYFSGDFSAGQFLANATSIFTASTIAYRAIQTVLDNTYIETTKP